MDERRSPRKTYVEFYLPPKLLFPNQFLFFFFNIQLLEKRYISSLHFIKIHHDNNTSMNFSWLKICEVFFKQRLIFLSFDIFIIWYNIFASLDKLKQSHIFVFYEIKTIQYKNFGIYLNENWKCKPIIVNEQLCLISFLNDSRLRKFDHNFKKGL